MSTTRVTTRNSATEEVDVAACVDKINSLMKRSRHASRTADSSKDSTPSGEGSSSRNPDSGHEDGTNLTALKLWDQMFKTKDLAEIAGKCDFLHNRVNRILSLGQV